MKRLINETSEKVYSVNELTKLYGVSRSIIDQWIRSGQLEAVIVPNLHADRHYYKGLKETDCDGIGVLESTLDKFSPDMSFRSIQLLTTKNRKKYNDAYLDWLDKREKDLYDEIEFIGQMKKYVKDIEPYL